MAQRAYKCLLHEQALLTDVCWGIHTYTVNLIMEDVEL